MSKNHHVVYGHPMSIFDDVLTTKEVSEVLGVTTRQVHRFAQNGILAPAYKIEGKRGAMLFHAKDVAELDSARESRRLAKRSRTL